jgi:flagellar hook-length control protein FliK
VSQLSPKLVKLPGLGEGVHRLTLDVKPEAIGAVTVVAHIRPDSVRIELVGASPAAREALRGVLDDLRRDLAATGSNASLDLGSGTSTGTGARGDRAAAPASPWAPAPAGPDAVAPSVLPASPGLKAGAGRVDVLA